MEMTIKDAAKAYLDANVQPGSILLLTTDDGSNRYSTVGGTCAIGDKFQFVALTADDPDYDIAVTNNAGLTIKTNADTQLYLSNGLILDRVFNQLSLRDDSGVLDSAVGLVTYTAEEKSKLDLKQEMQTLGTRIC
ncbi:iron-sulfur cluster biosynthesis family protein [Levilactobacillus tujiorum]|uniref:Iron-sulfur cluster biosynthesis family protein n=1 Tax=Levilactobacillus tujiorum TaxID=2912243 RepID=A0ABX1L4J5_9LACO|nr:iron-sulfur cluster biosynthesis family protein [Levilactobacillus tujiorum]MCH5464960.1 iron-sulfur cluster biosynthesis family protein [Levilactobacillus tujiorum]NLR12002.1 iron-sulfur cluster biosynthesis family protein [Lactobacillus sp. HBUAS51387]NLR29950.1 iron-sulfur cluster biosynthesis family protein [Levilactobacillus tujiorum]NLR32391.1 iron-sulfur cluster biosynthesis family protein [Levilactobacillus tujiorum]